MEKSILKIKSQKSTEINGMRFYNRKDYLNRLQSINPSVDTRELLKDKELVRAIQTHWHGDGQNGCLFAQVAAKKSTIYGWRKEVFYDDFSEYTEKIVGDINNVVTIGINDKSCELLSLIFPNVESEIQLVNLITVLIKTESIFLEGLSSYQDFTTVSLRADITGTGVLSWLMGFGPFEYLPNTRKSPFVELVIRTKPKREKMFEKLSKDQTVAHNADIPLHFNDVIANRLWSQTFKSTEKILGHKPNIFSAAKTTFTIPTKMSELFIRRDVYNDAT